MGTVIVLGDREDPHVAKVMSQIENLREHACVVMGVGDNFGLVAFDLTLDAPRLRLDDHWFEPGDIVSVWDRARSSMPILEDETWQYVFRERKAFVESFQAFAPAARWMNPLSSSVLA